MNELNPGDFTTPDTGEQSACPYPHFKSPDQSERERLRQWKEEATTVIAGWDALWETLGRPGQLGESKAVGCKSELERLRRENEELKEAFKRQAASAKMGMDAAKEAGFKMLERGQQLAAESNPDAIESERAMNTQLTQELETAERQAQALRELLQELWEEFQIQRNQFGSDAIWQKYEDAELIQRLEDQAPFDGVALTTEAEQRQQEGE